MYSLAYHYIRWHYSTALSDLAGIIRNFLWFWYTFFSIPMLVRTLFVPFHLLKDTAPRHVLDIPAFAEGILISTLMRLVGFFLRTLLIISGLFLLCGTALFGTFFYLTWLCVPLLLAGLSIFGFGLLLFF